MLTKLSTGVWLDLTQIVRIHVAVQNGEPVGPDSEQRIRDSGRPCVVLADLHGGSRARIDFDGIDRALAFRDELAAQVNMAAALQKGPDHISKDVEVTYNPDGTVSVDAKKSGYRTDPLL